MKNFSLVLLALSSFAATTLAVTPPPDGGYPNQNTAEGEDALFSLTTGTDNAAVGFQALNKNTTGGLNVAIGSTAMLNNTSGSGNTAVGDRCLYSNTTGALNVAIGDIALYSNRSGMSNVAVGTNSMYANTSGYYNTAIGQESLHENTLGVGNTGLGYRALQYNKTGNSNTAVGYYALSYTLNAPDYGSGNTAIGSTALLFNTTGGTNLAAGAGAMLYNTTGSFNTAAGGEALQDNTEGTNNTAYGYRALSQSVAGNNNIAIGYNAGYNLTGSRNIDIGNSGVAGESNTMRLGRDGQQGATYIAGISGVTVAGGVAVMIDSTGRLGTLNSSARYKEAIKPMAKSSEVLLSLKPVSFRYKEELDPEKIPQFGLVAEEVAKVDPELVVKDKSGKPYTVRYEAVNAMLLNEFLKEHQKVEEQSSEIAELKSKMERLEAVVGTPAN